MNGKIYPREIYDYCCWSHFYLTSWFILEIAYEAVILNSTALEPYFSTKCVAARLRGLWTIAP